MSGMLHGCCHVIAGRLAAAVDRRYMTPEIHELCGDEVANVTLEVTMFQKGVDMVT